MVLPRSSNYSAVFHAHSCRRARIRIAGPSRRQIGRRFYASGHHEAAKKSSDLPWLIGSVVITVPAATWLWQQGPKISDHTGDHGHGNHEDHNEHGERSDQPKGEDEATETSGDIEEQKSDETEGSKKQDSKDGENDTDKSPPGEAARNEPPNEITATEDKSTSEDEGLKKGPDDSLHKKSQQTKSVDPDADESKKDGPGDVDKGHEGEQKGTRVTEQDEERKSEDTRTNSTHPYMADERKSKKGEGIVDTAKITGTVDVNRKLR